MKQQRTVFARELSPCVVAGGVGAAEQFLEDWRELSRTVLSFFDLR